MLVEQFCQFFFFIQFLYFYRIIILKMQTRAQDGLSRLIAAAVTVYVCACANMTAAGIESAEDPFQYMFVSNWSPITLMSFYIPLFLLFLFFQQKVFLEGYYRCRFCRFHALWRARGAALVWDCLLYEALMQLAFLLFSVLLGRWSDYGAHIGSIALSAVGQMASLLLLSLLAAILCAVSYTHLDVYKRQVLFRRQ